MLTLLLPAIALAGELVIDAKVPVEVRMGNQPLAQTYVPALLRLPAPTGPAELQIFVDGAPHKLHVEIPEVGESWVIAGRTGLSTEQRVVAPPEVVALVQVEVRAVGKETVLVQVGNERHLIRPDSASTLELPPGRHAVKVRSADATVIWATGHLDLDGTSPVRMQVSDGRMPEVSGPGVRWTSGGR
jgi:hypothetical protein